MEKNNKLGLNFDDLQRMEETIVDFKIQAFHPYITFNLESLDIEYLKRLHAYLFGDLYEDAGTLSPYIKESDYPVINDKIKKVEDMIQYIEYVDDIEVIKDEIEDIIDMQIFHDGNNRTRKLFFKTMIEGFRHHNIKKYDELTELLSKKVRGLK